MMNYVQDLIQKILSRFKKRLEDSIPDIYVGKHSDEELLLLNDTVSVPSSSKPSTPVYETQQEQREPNPSSKQKGTSTFLVKGPE